MKGLLWICLLFLTNAWSFGSEIKDEKRHSNEKDLRATFPKIPGPLGSMVKKAWDSYNPNSLNNMVKAMRDTLEQLKEELRWLEMEVLYADDLGTIDYLIQKYEEVGDSNSTEARQWANTAKEMGSDGFDKTLESLKAMILGKGGFFSDTSIFEVTASNAASGGKEGVCVAVQEAYHYLSGLWIIGHTVWSQAYRITNDRFEYHAQRLKQKALTEIVPFYDVKMLNTPCVYDKCNKQGVRYGISFTHKTTETEYVDQCQDFCIEDDICSFWTFRENTQNTHTHNHTCYIYETNAKDPSDIQNYITGPKICNGTSSNHRFSILYLTYTVLLLVFMYM